MLKMCLAAAILASYYRLLHMELPLSSTTAWILADASV